MPNVTQVLQQAPQLIATKSEEVESWRKVLDVAKHRLEVARASATMKNEGAKNQKLLEAAVTLDKEVQDAEAEVIRAKAQVAIAEINLQEIENQFTSARKLANMQNTIGEIRSRSDQSPRPQ